MLKRKGIHTTSNGKAPNYLNVYLNTNNQWAYPEAFRRRHTGLAALKLGAQLRGELMPNNSSHLIISSTQMRLYVLRYLSMMLRNVELQTLFMLGCATQFC